MMAFILFCLSKKEKFFLFSIAFFVVWKVVRQSFCFFVNGVFCHTLKMSNEDKVY